MEPLTCRDLGRKVPEEEAYMVDDGGVGKNQLFKIGWRSSDD